MHGGMMPHPLKYRLKDTKIKSSVSKVSTSSGSRLQQGPDFLNLQAKYARIAIGILRYETLATSENHKNDKC